MVQLADKDIKTREVLDWEGVHLLHYRGSSCSQKTRIVLNLKGVSWESHIVDLKTQQNNGEWFMGINPRGLVPVLVHDGAVHIESNDIITYLDEHYPEPRLIPEGSEREIAQLLEHEDDLHLDLRSLSMRFLYPPGAVGKSAQTLESYQRFGSGTVQGAPDAEKCQQLRFWQDFNDNDGVTDEAVVLAVDRFRETLDELESTLERHAYLLGDSISLMDVAWFVYVNRLMLVGYPIEDLHPRVGAWFARLARRPEFADEVAPPSAQREYLVVRQAEDRRAGKSLRHIAGL